MEKVLITPRSFGKTSNEPYDLIKASGYEIVRNPYGRIMTKEQMCEAIQDVAGIIVGVDPLDAEVLAHAKHIRAIAKYGVGTDNIDKEFTTANSIPVSITAGANSDAVADFAFALMMACSRKITCINHMCHEKNWCKIVGMDIYGKTLGILGLGAIGRGVAKRAKGFDMKVMAYDVYWNSAYARENNILYATPEEICKKCDFISLHMPLTPETRNMIDSKAFASMKKNAIIVNTARGGLIEESALIDALKKGTISGAGIDVFEEEPPKKPELYTLENLIMGSHSAASTIGASEAMSMMATQNLLRDLKKK